MNERWATIPESGGRYEVSDLGRVRSFARRQSRMLCLKPRSNGYVEATLSIDGRRVDVGVHRLVMAAHAGPCPDGCEVDHIDRNKANNRLDNLRYLTHEENIGRVRGVLRAAPVSDRLDLDLARSLLSQGLTLKAVAERMGCSKNTIHRLVRKRADRFTDRFGGRAGGQEGGAP